MNDAGGIRQVHAIRGGAGDGDGRRWRADAAADAAIAEVAAAGFDEQVARDAAVVHHGGSRADGDIRGDTAVDHQRAALDDRRAGVVVVSREGELAAAALVQAAGAGDHAIEGRRSATADGEIGRAEFHARAGAVVGLKSGDGLEVDAG